jgi:hypothetical protein
LLLPLFVPRNVQVSLEFDGPGGAVVVVSVAGQEAASVPTGPGGRVFRVPAANLVRGDNILRLRGPRGVGIRLLRFDTRVEKTGARR